MVNKTPRVETLKLIEAIVDLERQNIVDFQIAKKLGITPQYVHKLKKTYPEQFSDLRQSRAEESGEPEPVEKAHQILESLSPAAARKLGEIMNNPKAGTREQRQAAKDILEKAGVGDQPSGGDGGLKDMKLIMAKIYKDCNFIEGKDTAIDAEIVEEPQIPSEIHENGPQ